MGPFMHGFRHLGEVSEVIHVVLCISASFLLMDTKVACLHPILLPIHRRWAFLWSWL